MKKITRLFALCGLLFSQGAVYAEPVELDRIVAVVNDEAITQSALENEVQSIKIQLRQQSPELPPDAVLQQQVLDRLIMKQIQQQLARSNNIVVDEITLNRAISNIAEQNSLTVERLRQLLEQDGIDFNAYRENIRFEILQQRLRQRYVNNRITISETEVEQFLAQQKARGNQDDEYRIGHILISLPESPQADDIANARARGEMILQQLAQGTDFAQAAISHSDGQLAFSGGDLGWRKLGQLPSLFASTVAEMQVGDVSDLIRSPSGFHIVQLTEHRGGERHVVNQTHARHILLKTNELINDAAARQRLLELMDRIENGDDFAALARSNSDDKASAAKGGDLGWANPGDMVPAFEEMMNSLPVGEVSEPFQSRFGWHIVEVLGRRQHDDTEQYIRNQARQQLFERKAIEEEELWLRRLRDEAYIEIRL